LNFAQSDLSFWDHVFLFADSIDWSEPWILGLIVFHITVFIVILSFRKKAEALTPLFLLLLVLVYLSETLNIWCASNWQKFATINYFDTSGSFIAFMFALPMIFNSIVVLILWVFRMGDMLVRVKKAELRHKKKPEATKAVPAKPVKKE